MRLYAQGKFRIRYSFQNCLEQSSLVFFFFLSSIKAIILLWVARSLRLSVCPFLLESLQGVGARWHRWLRWHICSYAARCFHVAIIFKMFSFPSSKFTSVTTDRFFKKKKVSLIHILNSLGKITCKRHFRPLFFFLFLKAKLFMREAKEHRETDRKLPSIILFPKWLKLGARNAGWATPMGGLRTQGCELILWPGLGPGLCKDRVYKVTGCCTRLHSKPWAKP